MKASEITKGGKYVMKVSGKLTVVRVDDIRENWAGRTVYGVTNLRTGRKTTARSSAKFRRAVCGPEAARVV